jgi:hypothetical protein
MNDWVWSTGRMILTRDNQSTHSWIYLFTTLFTTNPTWTGLASNCIFCSDRPELTARGSYNTVFVCCIETDLISHFIIWFASPGWHITVQLNDCTWSSGTSEGVGVVWRYAPALWCQNAGRLFTEAGCQSEHRWRASCGQVSLQVSHWLHCKSEIQYYSSQCSVLIETCFYFGASHYQMLEMCAQFTFTFRYFGFSVYFEHL